MLWCGDSDHLAVMVVEPPHVEQSALPRVGFRVQVRDAAHDKPAGYPFGFLPGAERGEGDLGELGAVDPPAGLLVEHRVGVLDRLPGIPADGRDRGLDLGVQPHRHRRIGPSA